MFRVASHNRQVYFGHCCPLKFIDGPLSNNLYYVLPLSFCSMCSLRKMICEYLSSINFNKYKCVRDFNYPPKLAFLNNYGALLAPLIVQPRLR